MVVFFFLYFGGIFEFIYFKKYHIYVNYFYVNELLCSFIFNFFNYIKISFQ